jgi:3-deoxy-D-manno-octulosonic acid kinase
MTTASETFSKDSLCVGSAITLTDDQLTRLRDLCRLQFKPAEVALQGRAAVIIDRIDGIGPVAVKMYRRGGFVRRLIKSHYLKIGPTRCQKEFELLQNIRRLGVNAPEPIAFAYSGRLCYLGWLITRAIDRPGSLIHLARTDTDAAQKIMPAVIEQFSLLIRHRIHHIDLHPGNVLIDAQDRVFIIDFDKGRVFSGSRNKLRDHYLHRWQRAVRKHGLPLWLGHMLDTGLGGHPDGTIAKKQSADD